MYDGEGTGDGDTGPASHGFVDRFTCGVTPGDDVGGGGLSRLLQPDNDMTRKAAEVLKAERCRRMNTDLHSARRPAT